MKLPVGRAASPAVSPAVSRFGFGFAWQKVARSFEASPHPDAESLVLAADGLVQRRDGQGLSFRAIGLSGGLLVAFLLASDLFG